MNGASNRAGATLRAWRVVALACAALLIAVSPIATAAPFGDRGTAIPAIRIPGGQSRPAAVLQQADGKVLVVGTAEGPIATTIFAARYSAAGVADPAYGTAGIVYVDIPPDLDHLTASAATLDGAGNLVVAGQSIAPYPIQPDTNMVVVRLLPTGTPDLSFGVAGIVRPPIPGYNAGTTATGIAVDSQERIVVGGGAHDSSAGQGGFLVLRLTPSGLLDAGFNATGFRVRNSPYNEEATSLALTLADGILVAGEDDPFSVTPFAIVRLTSGGALDTTFGGTGVVHLSHGFAVASNAAGNVLVASQGAPNPQDTVAVTRLTATGAIDPTFGSSGSSQASLTGLMLNPFLRTIRVDGAQRIVLAVEGYGPLANAPAALRFNANGGIDAGFGVSGFQLVQTDPTFNLGSTTVLGLGLGDGVFLAGGYSSNLVAHLTATGALDPSFNGTGSITQAFGTQALSLTGMVRQPDGRLVILGLPGNQAGIPSADFVVARLTLAGVLDPSFNGTGVRFIGDGNVDYSAISLDGIGRIVLGGAALPSTLRLVRLLADGTSDLSFNGTGSLELPGSAGFRIAADSQGNILLSYGSVMRILTSGIVDSAFGVAGVAPVFAMGVQGVAVTTDNLDRPLIGGIGNDGTNATFAVARLTTSGMPDPGFGTAGVALVPLGAETSAYAVDAIAIDASGRSVVVGTATVDTIGMTAAARITDTGLPDVSFNGTGFSVLQSMFRFPRALAHDPSGRIVVTGGGYSTRLAANGAVDPTFNAGQLLPTSILPGSLLLDTAALVADSSGTYVAGSGGRTMAVVRLFDGVPTKLAMLFSGNGANVAVTPFDLTIEAQDAAGNAQPVASATSVVVTLLPGPQTLLGPASCTIPAGKTFCVLTGVAFPISAWFQLQADVTGGPPLQSALSREMYITWASVAVTIASHTPNPSAVGQPITVTATVSAPSAVVAPTGYVGIRDANLSSPSCTFQLPATSCSFSPGLPGTRTLLATYQGDSAFATRDSPAVTHVVTPSTVPPKLASAVSAKSHGGAGSFALPLSLNPANPTTEPRQGPTHSVVLNFDKSITSATAAITEGVATVSSPFPLGSQMFVTLSGVADRQYVTISLTNLTSPDGSTGSASLRIGFLAGDANQSRTVTLADLGLVNAQLAQPVTLSNYLRDVNASGTITVADKGITNANLTKALPAP